MVIFHCYVNVHQRVITSNTVQGGDGSFKNRKPIGSEGWLLWLTDGRVNPLMDQQVVGVVELSICLTVYPSIHLSFFSLYWSICLSICPSLCLSSICLALYPSMQPSIHHPISVYVSICLSFSLLLSFEICQILCISVCLVVGPSSCLSGHPAIHSIHWSTAFHQSIFLVLHLST